MAIIFDALLKITGRSCLADVSQHHSSSREKSCNAAFACRKTFSVVRVAPLFSPRRRLLHFRDDPFNEARSSIDNGGWGTGATGCPTKWRGFRAFLARHQRALHFVLRDRSLRASQATRFSGFACRCKPRSHIRAKRVFQSSKMSFHLI